MPDISAATADKAAKTVQIPATDGRVDPKALRVAQAGVFSSGFGPRMVRNSPVDAAATAFLRLLIALPAAMWLARRETPLPLKAKLLQIVAGLPVAGDLVLWNRAVVTTTILGGWLLWRETLLYKFGLDPKSDEARWAIAPVHEAARWDYFEGEVEPCINGRAVAIGAYFGQDVRGIIDRLLTATTSHRSRPRPPTTLTTEPSNSRSSQTTESPHSPGRFSAFFSRLLE